MIDECDSLATILGQSLMERMNCRRVQAMNERMDRMRASSGHERRIGLIAKEFRTKQKDRLDCPRVQALNEGWDGVD